MFELQPTLAGKLLTLRPLLPSDFAALFAVAADPLLWEQHPERERYKQEVFQKFFAAALDTKGALVAVDIKTEAVIGSSRFTGYNSEKQFIEIGYTFIARSHWQKGYNREMKALMLAHAFQFVNEVHFYIGASNYRSRQAIEKIGARLVEEYKRTPLEGAPYTAAKYAIQKQQTLF